ncbi:MAG: hypothetical protein COA69_02800 [Robiginitomaculum sp.]|nr:MAG: hypothetical protein COA69_02800 [Robiginitomaculum sp.]
MSRRFLQVIGAVFVLSALMGWLRAGLAPVDGSDLRDSWRGGESEEAPDTYAILNARLKATGLFPISEQRAEEIADEERAKTGRFELSEGVTPSFPKIEGASIVDGFPQVHLRLEDGQIISAGRGETLELGWTLKMVDLDRVIAVYDGQEHEFKVIDYKEREVAGQPNRATDR